MVEYIFKINCVSVYVLECLIIVMRVILYIYKIKKKKIIALTLVCERQINVRSQRDI